MKYQILQGDNRTTLKSLPDNSIDAIVTDPPYGIDFLGKNWDANTGALETYQECLRVLKPGGHILAFSAARTYHHLAVTLEQAGFEIRDQIMWIYSSGFPKSQDVGRQLHKKAHGKPDKQRFDPSIMIKVSGDQYQHPESGKIYRALPDINGDRLAVSHEGKTYGVVYEQVIEVDSEWSGWGSALKPAHEPIALARKPMKGSIRDNVLKHGVGALNIDATRVPFAEDDTLEEWKQRYPDVANGTAETHANFNPELQGKKKKKSDVEIYLNNKKGPMERAKIADGENIGMFDGGVGYKAIKRAVDPVLDLPAGRFPSNVLGEIPLYQKYFYCPKVSRRERHIGHEMPPPMFGDVSGAYGPDGNRMAVGLDAREGNAGNNHPTVKPIELMKYLIRLITPPGGTVLDPFNGSGSTGCAAVELGYEYIGCELDPAYVEIAEKRIQAWYKAANPTTFNRLFEVE